MRRESLSNGEENREKQRKKEANVIIHFLRHGKKEVTKLGQKDEDVLLTPRGREQAHKKYHKKEGGFGGQTEISIAKGSPRVRSQEVATRAMQGDRINQDTGWEELKQEMQPRLINESELSDVEKQEILRNLKFGKIHADERLNFVDEGAWGEVAEAAYCAGRRLEFLVNDSDRLLLELGDKKSFSFSRQAGNIAELIKQYVIVSINFDKIVQKDQSKYAKFGNQLERYLGSHAGVGESFLTKVIKAIKGDEAAREYVQKKPAGFQEAEGFDIEIIPADKPEEVTIVLHYMMDGKEEEIKFKSEILDTIIQQREELKAQLEKNNL